MATKIKDIEVIAKAILDSTGRTLSRGTVEVAVGGYREDLKQFFRSKMEANTARYFNKIHWEYEPKEFEFPIKRGNRYYKPDFYLPAYDLWIEVKGYFRSQDKTKLRRFKKYYPEEFSKLRFVIPDKYAKSVANGEMMNFLLDDLKINFEDIEDYKEMQKFGKLIPEWE